MEMEEHPSKADNKALSESESYRNHRPPSPSPSKSNKAMGNNSDFQQSSSKQRRHQRGGRKKKGAAGIEDEYKPEQVVKSAAVHNAETNATPNDYSDAASVDSRHLSPRCRHQRGGRKTNGQERLSSVSGFSVGGSQLGEQRAFPSPEVQDWNSDEDYDAQKLRKAKASRPSSSKNKPPRADAGIRAFNLERTGESQEQPFVGIERPESRSKASKERSRGKRSVKRREERSDEGSDEEVEKKKAPSIRLDLNLELEIVLKAKIKGDITISFLQ